MNAILSVKELTFAIKKQLESNFSFITVKGEISNLKVQSSGHIYFTLKDDEAQISAVFFRGNATGLQRMPKDGDQVIVKGELSVYAPRGNYQLIVRKLEYSGVGELLLKLHELKRKLEERGWFAREHKKALPKWPKTIGVVTSQTGSVIQDIIHVLSRRFPDFHLILNPVKVQGEGAALEIARAIEEFNRYELADVLIVGRGGGSLEDLFCFNEECVAKAIYESKIPIISAVGHETDFTIADFVADVRAATPSAAAEIVIAEKSLYVDLLKRHREQMRSTLSILLKSARHKLRGIAGHPFFQGPTYLLSDYYQKIDDGNLELKQIIQAKLAQKKIILNSYQKQLNAFNPTVQLQSLKYRFGQIDKLLGGAIAQKIGMKKEFLKKRIELLRSIDPKNLLKKGYCIPFDEMRNSVILSAKSLSEGTNINLLMHDGQVAAQVHQIKIEAL